MLKGQAANPAGGLEDRPGIVATGVRNSDHRDARKSGGMPHRRVEDYSPIDPPQVMPAFAQCVADFNEIAALIRSSASHHRPRRISGENFPPSVTLIRP